MMSFVTSSVTVTRHFDNVLHSLVYKYLCGPIFYHVTPHDNKKLFFQKQYMQFLALSFLQIAVLVDTNMN